MFAPQVVESMGSYGKDSCYNDDYDNDNDDDDDYHDFDDNFQIFCNNNSRRI